MKSEILFENFMELIKEKVILWLHHNIFLFIY